MKRFLSLLLVFTFMTMTLLLNPPAHALRYEGEEGEKTTKSMKPSRTAPDSQKGSKGTPAPEKGSDKAPEPKDKIRIKIHPKVEGEGEKE